MVKRGEREKAATVAVAAGAGRREMLDPVKKDDVEGRRES